MRRVLFQSFTFISKNDMKQTIVGETKEDIALEIQDS